jgi:2-keto-4-pentenoate hydratase/2-oxohepta-3-ene-1,7-dioic acid hydratase in catechol pathway
MVTYLARYEVGDDARWGVVTAAGIAPLEGTHATTAELVTDTWEDWRIAATREPVIDAGAARFLSPITTPCRVMCQGANYRQHAIESGMDPDNRTFNLFLTRPMPPSPAPTTPSSAQPMSSCSITKSSWPW